MVEKLQQQKTQPAVSGHVLPHSVEAEQSVIGALLRDNTAWDRICDRLVAADFYHHTHRVIFERIVHLAKRGQPFDVVTLTAALKGSDVLKTQEDETYLYRLTHETPGVVNIIAYADIVRERSVFRQLIQCSNDIAAAAYHPEGREPKEVLDLAEGRIFAIAEHHTRGQGPVAIDELLTVVTDRLDELQSSKSVLSGLSTGFTDLDHLTGGLQKSDLVIVAGRPSMGKTALAMNIAEHVAVHDKKTVLIFSLEMPGDGLVMRMLSSLGSVDQKKIRSGQLTEHDWAQVVSAMGLLSKSNIFIDDTPGLSPMEIRARARRIARRQSEDQPLDLIVIDYLQLMHIPGYPKANRTLEISEISRSLKELAKELSIPVVALSQLNRGLEQRSDKRPVMSDLRESGAIEQDADIIVFIYRDEMYNPDSQDAGTAELIISKHRNGPTGKVRLSFAGQYTCFRNYASSSVIVSAGSG